MTEIYYEKPSRTAKKVKEALSLLFPDATFDIKVNQLYRMSSLLVSWVDGPMDRDVNVVLKKFRTGYMNKYNRYIETGYRYNGNVYVGASFVSGIRHLSFKRKELIFNRVLEQCKNDFFKILEWERAEMELIDKGLIDGYSSEFLAFLEDPLFKKDIGMFIEKKRNELHLLQEEKGCFLHPDVIRKSKELDQLIVHQMKLKKPTI